MTAQMAADMRRGSDGNRRYILPVAEKLFGGKVGLTDRQHNAFEKNLDCLACIDGVALSNAGIIPFASRVQYGKNFHAHSIRIYRPPNEITGEAKATEYQKIYSAIEHKFFAPRYHFHAFISDCGSAVVGVVKTLDLWRYLRQNFSQLKRIINRDATEAIIADWYDMRRAGVDVKTFAVSNVGDVKEFSV